MKALLSLIPLLAILLAGCTASTAPDFTDGSEPLLKEYNGGCPAGQYWDRVQETCLCTNSGGDPANCDDPQCACPEGAGAFWMPPALEDLDTTGPAADGAKKAKVKRTPKR